MKNTFNVLAVIVALALGYFAFTYKTPPTQAPTDSAAQGKLDINAVCDGALAYMSFPDGASAKVFLAECKEGKRPEVIEKYKADLELDGAAI